MRTQGRHVTAWDEFRHHGPLAGMRWEPHPAGPISHHPRHGVSYQGVDIATCLAEVFQTTRCIDTHTGKPQIIMWTPTRPVPLLDVTGTWPIRQGASAALMSAPRPVCTAWAQAIHHDLPQVEGIMTRSTMTGNAVVVLFTAAASAFPAAPDHVVSLSSDIGVLLAHAAAVELGYALL
ncbi:RES family NAD+ phosphorylase [Austwickia sp. TVS 96-490-7B]|uniref:RES family NAD+ phosphorylase n=1 Tax=Austwickia sp. TVS 96-490-7B TaxID=2830843 RepID=UPI001C588BCC|nr:RES family NAD+ phosphorylase [Austwickia sp. TVS 96-490-7B]